MNADLCSTIGDGLKEPSTGPGASYQSPAVRANLRNLNFKRKFTRASSLAGRPKRRGESIKPTTSSSTPRGRVGGGLKEHSITGGVGVRACTTGTSHPISSRGVSNFFNTERMMLENHPNARPDPAAGHARPELMSCSDDDQSFVGGVPSVTDPHEGGTLGGGLQTYQCDYRCFARPRPETSGQGAPGRH